ncbi:AsnC family transcriptional regulator [Natronomonas sp. EA1]|uniref:AsnC family transcriptional regulator n=1 Tax=Natronomonas sp. EA1 TaxID=3421655 RepID=UPI003EBA9141
MRDLDDIDRHVLRLLLEDARRPYSDIAEHVDLSGPAVSDRVERLQEMGVIRRFTVDLDRSRLREGLNVLLELETAPESTEGTRETLAGLDGVEHVFETAEGALVVSATVPTGDVRAYLEEQIDLSQVRTLRVRLLAGSEWTPDVGEATLGLECAECGNRVTSQGTSAVVGETRYEFCCPTCESRFRERYEQMQSGV